MIQHRALLFLLRVVTANKKAQSGPLDYYDELQRSRRSNNTHFLYETSVGAGLPIIQTLRDLKETGDYILSIEGIFSGTLAYLFNVFDGTTPFSAIVREARDSGYTEPDPRDDLSGMDVARKLLIIAREVGLQLELDDIEVEPAIPMENIVDVDKADLIEALQSLDEAFAQCWGFRCLHKYCVVVVVGGASEHDDCRV